MRQLVTGISLVIVMIIVSCTVWMLGEQQVRKEELEKALSHASKQTMQMLAKKKNEGEGCDGEWMKTEFTDCFFHELKSDGEIQICFYTTDAEKGLLDVEIREIYRVLTGQTKTVSARKTVLCERMVT